MRGPAGHFSLLSVIDSLGGKEMTDSVKTFLQDLARRIKRLHLGNLYHLKAKCLNSAKETGAALKKGKQCPGSEESPKHRKEARE